MERPAEVADMTAVQLLRLFRQRKLSPVEAAEAALQRIERFNPIVNAFCLIDPETTLAAARQSEARYLDSEPRGLLDGVPVAIKDVFLTSGWPNLKGSKTIDAYQAWTVDAPAVAALKRHGFVPLGKTTTPEFGWKGVTDCPTSGVTRNPWDPTRTAGGSSGGSGAAVPLGMGPLALGTDAGGSIRIPAGFCGLVGLKPTQGRAPLWPPSPFGVLAHAGPMTWTVEDAALLMDVLAESDPRDTTLPPTRPRYQDAIRGNIEGWRIAYSPDLGRVAVDPEIANGVEEAVRILERDLGAEVEQVDPGFGDLADAFSALFFGGAANLLRDKDENERRLIDPALVEVADQAGRMSALDYLAAENRRAELLERTNRFHQQWALLVTPTLPITAFEAGREVPPDWHSPRWHSWTPFTYPFNLTGQPAISIPCGFTRAGLPYGIQIVGPRHRDDAVLRAAALLQEAMPLTDIRPKLLNVPAARQEREPAPVE